MKRNIKAIIVLLMIMAGTAYSGIAQIYVTVRPNRPVYTRPAPPSPRHVWIDEDWNGRDDRYEWHGGLWVEPPTPGYVYVRGHWGHTRHGYHWVPGRWNAPRGHHHRHGHRKGHKR